MRGEYLTAPSKRRPVSAKTTPVGRLSPWHVAISERRVVVIVRRFAGRQAAANGFLSNFAIGVTMRPDKTFQVLDLAWLVALALLASQVGATEQVTLSAGPTAADRSVGKPVASNAAKLAVAAQESVVPRRGETFTPRLCELEQRLFDQVHDGRFGEFSLLEAGLIASGVDRCDELHRYCKQFEAIVESL